MNEVRIACVSDTHTMLDQITYWPEADILVHAGDLLLTGTKREAEEELEVLNNLPYNDVVLIAGNHDFFFDDLAPAHFRSWTVHPGYTPEKLRERKLELLKEFPRITYLEDSSATIQGLKFYGSPWVPYFWQPNNEVWAFNFPQIPFGGLETAREKWAKIPDDVEILLTHTPPLGILDGGFENHYGGDDRAGCPELRNRVEQLPNLAVHVFGHIHAGYGAALHPYSSGNRTVFVNASTCNPEYQPINPVQVIGVTNGK